MPTPSEQKALAFLAFVILLGGAVRVVRAGSPPPSPTPESQLALARQTDAAESAGQRAASKRRPRGAKMSRSRRDGGVDTVAGVAGVPFSDVRPDRPSAAASRYNPREGWVNGYPPPSPRLDVGGPPADPRGALRPPGPGREAAGGSPTAAGPLLDLDVASAAEVDALPRIGAAMAARIVANRDSFGPFRSLEGLRRVRGMGPATLERLAPRVTFSGRPASLNAGSRYH